MIGHASEMIWRWNTVIDISIYGAIWIDNRFSSSLPLGEMVLWEIMFIAYRCRRHQVGVEIWIKISLYRHQLIISYPSTMTVCRLNNICLMDLILLIKYYMLNICSIFTSRNRFLMQIESMIEKKGLLNTFHKGWFWLFPQMVSHMQWMCCMNFITKQRNNW